MCDHASYPGQLPTALLGAITRRLREQHRAREEKAAREQERLCRSLTDASQEGMAALVRLSSAPKRNSQAWDSEVICIREALKRMRTELSGSGTLKRARTEPSDSQSEEFWKTWPQKQRVSFRPEPALEEAIPVEPAPEQ